MSVEAEAGGTDRRPPRFPEFLAWFHGSPRRLWRRMQVEQLDPPPWWRRSVLTLIPLAAAALAGLTLGVWAAVLAVTVVAVLLWWGAHNHVRRYRQECQAALPDALSLMASGLRAGHSLQQSLTAAVRAGGPLQNELARVQLLIRLGETVPDALTEMARRIDSEELDWVAIAIRINAGVGGDMGALLTTIAATIRDRDVLRRTARVLSAEGRLSAWVLGALPPTFIVLLLFLRPDHLAPLVNDSRGWLMVAASLALFAVGVFWLRRAVRLEV